MFTYQHYVPIMKAEEGEMAALSELTEQTAAQFTPMLVFAAPDDMPGALTKEQLEEYLALLTSLTGGKWPFKHPVFIDLLCMHTTKNEEINPVEFIFDELEKQGIQAVPVITFSCSEEFKNQVADVHKKFKRGVCIRIVDQDFGVVSVQNLLQEILKTVGCKREEVDIVLDYKTVHASLQYAIFASAIYRLNALPHLQQWRTITIAGVSYPTYIKQVREILNQMPRVEWNIWKDILKTPIKRLPAFGDYDTFHPIHPDRDPRDTKENPRLRYTIEGSWLVLNNEDIHTLSAAEFKKICKELVESGAFCGKDFSWGDNFIYNIAQGKVHEDRDVLWRKACTNHHVTFITTALKNL
ncbi:MAG TPA: beta family protein [Patescibacteria group bacterium]|nr:beta family protein [Patescibacteria group bacterium]